MVAPELKNKKTEKGSDSKVEQPSTDELTILSPMTEWFCLALCSCLFLITPLYYLSLTAKGDWKEKTPPLLESIARKIFSFPLQGMEGFIPVRTVNAEYKLVVFLALASVVTESLRSPKNVFFAFQGHFFFSVDCFSGAYFCLRFLPTIFSVLGSLPCFGTSFPFSSGFPWLTFVGQEKKPYFV